MSFNPDTPRSRDEVLLQAIVSGDSSMMGDPRDREEEFVKAIADKETLPDYSEASEGDVLQIGSDGPEWGAVPNELPAIAAGDAGKVLKVNSGETGTEWGAVPNELPAIAAGDAGKVLKVNSGENGVEWGAVGGTKYQHNIKIVYGTTYITFSFINEVSTPYTTAKNVAIALYAKFSNHDIIATGFANNTIINYLHAQGAGGTYLSLIGIVIDFANSALTPNSSFTFDTTSRTATDDVTII